MYTVALAEDAELGPLEPWQAEEFLAHMDRARATVDPFIPWAGISTDLDSARNTLQRYADKQATDTGRIYGIRLGGTLVGGVMYVRFDTRDGVCEIGAWTEPAGRGRGLVTAAAGRLLDYALVERGLYRAEWWNSTVNPASRAVARRLGMTLDGTMRRATEHHGERLDLEVWSMLAPEWRELRASA
ncbi:GNAT family N-acetyltransferase [Kitasatospora cheerisanensis]|uniref:Acetyltransferase n=1 Tax=Kitasatospora cheerisanensis KCTC 2395 TaxID=1348663 RepID=A0A066YNJ7_9ACTN|nr:GNAT family protein [Kitasatospora cheerisanensis]KDN82742.1 acetyltransferase [Kitasatospora cheerisanensis KCTC 2395]